MTATLRRSALLIAVFLLASTMSTVGQDSKQAANPASADQTVSDLRALEQRAETATLHADAAFLQDFYASDFRFSHGTGVVANKTETLKALQPNFYISRDLDLTEVEPHGDVALTIGRIHVRTTSQAPDVREYTVWYVRVYTRRDGRWQLLSHRTTRQVSGPL
jgi:ketosteroid isomerase-like protein